MTRLASDLSKPVTCSPGPWSLLEAWATSLLRLP